MYGGKTRLDSIESIPTQVTGDIVKVVEGETFPCDLLLLASALDSGQCFINTANLDGETTVKVTPLAHRTHHR